MDCFLIDYYAIPAIEISHRSGKGCAGHVDIPVTMGGVTFHPGEWIYCDEDGLLVAAEALPL